MDKDWVLMRAWCAVWISRACLLDYVGEDSARKLMDRGLL